MIPDRPLWFKRKKYGYGWTPCAWQGWLVLVVYVVGVLLLITRLLPESTASSPTRLILGIVIWTGLLLIIAYRTGESPRWQWGNSNTDEVE